MRAPQLLTAAAFSTAVLFGVVRSFAADPAGDPLERPSADVGPAIDDPDAAALEPDFRFVGEYRGYERPSGSVRSSRAVSLQVNSTGAGTFVGTRTLGGTPAERDASANVLALEGRRSGSRVLLQRANRQAADGSRIPVRLRYVLDGQDVTVVDRGGRPVGELSRSARRSPTLGQTPPPGAIILFDGTGTQRLVNGRITPDGLLQEGTETVDPWDDFRMHLEFRLPYKPMARGQHRGNSGVYLQSRYELQVLDSFGWPAAFNDVGALYRTVRPDRNASLPPLEWQTYDIDFHAPEFAGSQKVRPARLTVWLNGVKIHDNRAIPRKTGAGKPEGPFPLPTKLQGHGNPVRFRNVWLLTDEAGGPFGVPDAPAIIPPVPISAVH